MLHEPYLSMNLFKAYVDYYENDNKEALLEAIKNYDWVNYEFELKAVFDAKPSPRGQSHKLDTSGSTGFRRSYEFGPHWEFWLLGLETEVKNQCNHPVLIVTEDYDYLYNRPQLAGRMHINWHPMEPYGVTCYRINYTDPSEEFFRFIESYGPFSVQTTPKCVLSLGKNASFVRAMLRSGSTLSTTNYEPFYSTSLFVNDNNITWDSGFAFYTCSYGHKHLLPTFYVAGGLCYSLVNVNHQIGSAADLIRLNDCVMCECGKKRVEFDFIPHIKTQPMIGNRLLYNPRLADRLVGRYTNMQFIKVVDKLVCVYEGEMVDDDLLRAFGVDEFLPDSFCCTARSHDKMAAFCDITFQSDKCVKQRKNK